MTDKYQLVFSVDEHFQESIDNSLSRLATIRKRTLPDGRRKPVRASKKCITHAGIMALDYLPVDALIALSGKMKIVNKQDVPDADPKHTAVELQKTFARMARLRSATLAVRFSYERSTKDLMHYGILSLQDLTDDAFEQLVHLSINVEEGDSLRPNAFYQRPIDPRF